MSSLPNAAVAVALALVVFVLFLGLANMLRQWSANRSQLLMRWRVGLQFVAIVLIVVALYFRGHHWFG